MCKNKSICRILTLVLALVLAFSMTTFAASTDEALNAGNQMSFEQAKAYLMSYSEVSINEDGKKITTDYGFTNEENLNATALYISQYGLEKFEQVLDAALEKAVKLEEISMNLPRIQPRKTNPVAARAYVTKKDGTYKVSGSGGGLIKFNKVGSVEYRADLSYQVEVKGKKFVRKRFETFDISYMSGGGSWGTVSFQGYVGDTQVGTTANYKVTKTISIPILVGSINVKSETQDDIFALLTGFKS